MSELPRAHGCALLHGTLRAAPEDFFVDEDLGFAPDGAGEHWFVHIEKRGANTDWVARELARLAGVAPEAVSYAGLKDRHAVTRQTFSVHAPGKREPEFAAIDHPEFRVLDVARHGRKLKRGALRGNRFRIVVRDIAGDRDMAETRLAAIAACGAPNYFGEQRFGRDGDNLGRAKAMFAGRRVPRHEHSLLLSAARSALFNAVLARRVEAGSWNRAVDGEVWMLAGRQSVFGPEPFTDALATRLAEFDIDPTGPLWGRGELRTAGEAATLERLVATEFAEIAAGLEDAGLEQERRRLRLRPESFVWRWESAALVVEMALPAGSYATTVLREVLV